MHGYIPAYKCNKKKCLLLKRKNSIKEKGYKKKVFPLYSIGKYGKRSGRL